MSTPAPSLLAAKLSDALDRAWRRGLLPYPSLDPDRLVAAAGGELGPDNGWRQRLGILTDALEREAELTPLGRTIAHGQIAKLLRQRAGAVRLWRRHPEIAARPVPRPIVILGQMRSGTTRLHRMLACDDRFAHTRCFETMSPISPRGIDLRPIRVAAGIRFLHALNPALATVHPTAPFAAEEEFGLLAFSFSGAQFEAQWRVPSFARHCEQADAAPVYAELHRLLQTIRWSRGEPVKPWLLKAPQYLQDLAALLGQFPDARLLCLSRDPLAVAASSASLAWQTMRLGCAAPDRAEAGREWLRKIMRRAEASAAARAAHSHVPQLEVSYDAMDADWRSEIRRIYEFLDMPLTRTVLLRMKDYIRRSGKIRKNKHSYSLAEFGLREAEVRAAVAGSG